MLTYVACRRSKSFQPYLRHRCSCSDGGRYSSGLQNTFGDVHGFSLQRTVDNRFSHEVQRMSNTAACYHTHDMCACAFRYAHACMVTWDSSYLATYLARARPSTQTLHRCRLAFTSECKATSMQRNARRHRCRGCPHHAPLRCSTQSTWRDPSVFASLSPFHPCPSRF